MKYILPALVPLASAANIPHLSELAKTVPGLSSVPAAPPVAAPVLPAASVLPAALSAVAPAPVAGSLAGTVPSNPTAAVGVATSQLTSNSLLSGLGGSSLPAMLAGKPSSAAAAVASASSALNKLATSVTITTPTLSLIPTPTAPVSAPVSGVPDASGEKYVQLKYLFPSVIEILKFLELLGPGVMDLGAPDNMVGLLKNQVGGNVPPTDLDALMQTLPSVSQKNGVLASLIPI